MQGINFKSGKWLMQAAPADGARITRLAYDGYDLLTGAPTRFRPPRRDYGRYETRPVHGYDDCFPSVDGCRYPGRNWRIPDHGELCWLPWAADPVRNGVRFTVKSQKMPVTFSRAMVFRGARLTWRFAVRSHARHPLMFQHVMHPLMPLAKIDLARLALPACAEAYDETNQCLWPAVARAGMRNAPSSGLDAGEILGGVRRGVYRMLILRGVKSGGFTLAFKAGPMLHIKFPRRHFTALGIWWNNRGYPDEAGLRRCECAFEPIPGPASSLARAARAGGALLLPPGETLAWQVEWGISSSNLPRSRLERLTI